MKNQIVTIWQASNDTSVLLFEDKEDAEKYAGSAGVCAGINVSPVSLVKKSIKGIGLDLSGDETRKSGHYMIANIEVKTIGYWNRGKFWQVVGDEGQYSSEQLSLISIERVEL